MGCHTWFSRPITKEEFAAMKAYAPKQIMEEVGCTETNIENGYYDKWLYDQLMKSYNKNLPCVYRHYWWQLGYGRGCDLLKDEFVQTIRGMLFVETPKYFDTFRVHNYPKKIIHNRRELRRWMKKKYFELNDQQLNRISEFFRKYPGGIIHFC